MKLKDILRQGRLDYESAYDPYIIAEAGVNHEGSIDTAIRLIEEAASGGANAIKFQTYRAHTLASRDSPAYWDTDKEPTESQFKLFQKYDSFWEDEFKIIKSHCDEVDIEFLSTPFDLDAAKFLDNLMSVYKISSSDITNKPFIEEICKFGKPIVLSTGASNHHEIRKALKWINNYKVPVCLLHCVLNYPTETQNANLAMILDLKKRFPENLIGYSDHTLGVQAAVSSVALGARIVEKHFGPVF